MRAERERDAERRGSQHYRDKAIERPPMDRMMRRREAKSSRTRERREWMKGSEEQNEE